MLTFGSLFAGIEGFGVGLERAGMQCVFQVEQDVTCNRVLARHYPDIPRFGDIREFSNASIAVRPDWLCGGFPCTDLSVAGKRAGLAGKRSGLFHEFVRLIREFSPRGVLIENVPGLLSSNGWRDMGTVVGALAELGYGWAYRSLDAQYFGLAQRRERVFIVGCLGDMRSAAEILFESESLPWHPAPSRKAGTRVASCLTSGVASGSGVNRPGRRREDDVNIVSYALNGKNGKRFDGESETLIANCLDSHMGSGGPDDNAAQGNHLVAATLTKQYASHYGRTAGTNGGIAENHLIAHTLRAEGHDASEDGTGRGVPLVAGFKRGQGSAARTDGWRLEQCPTLTSSDSGTQQCPGVQIGLGVRRLLPIECERLQGFDDGWTEGESDSARYRMLGNAVSPKHSEWIGQRIVQSTQAVK